MTHWFVYFRRFEDAGFTDVFLDNIRRAGWEKPTPIQKYAIPIIMAGHDMMACAQTGSGKTVRYFNFFLPYPSKSLPFFNFKAAYLLPILSSMLKRGELNSAAGESQNPGAIIMSPTRELAIQISSEAKFFACRK